jgi:outer membrane protein assembly factor BamA
VRRIEFQGNTTTRDKVIRRELALEEGGVYELAPVGTQLAAPESAFLFRSA